MGRLGSALDLDPSLTLIFTVTPGFRHDLDDVFVDGLWEGGNIIACGGAGKDIMMSLLLGSVA
jgi:hypothetical protein